MSPTTYRNAVFKRARQLAQAGQWNACDMLINRRGVTLTQAQRAAIQLAKQRPAYPVGDCQLQESLWNPGVSNGH